MEGAQLMSGSFTASGASAPEGVLQDFTTRWPGYVSPELDGLRATEFARLDATGSVYLDYTGAGLHGSSQVQQHFELLASTVLGNPHSVSPASQVATSLVQGARQAVLGHFKADPREYAVVFTANATAALRLVGENLGFDDASRLLLTQDNHNSVTGIACFARRVGAHVHWLRPHVPDLRLSPDELGHELASLPEGAKGLFAFPAQSNFSGVKHPLSLIGEAQRQGWKVLLDAAAFAPTNSLDLSKYSPDLVCLSFYKMMGYPTGLGCLLVRRETLATWQQPWSAGGNVKLASVLGEGYVRGDGEAAFEDGTIDFLSIPAVEFGLRFLQSVDFERLGLRLTALTGWTLEQLQALKHPSGAPVVRLFGPLDTTQRGATLAFTLLDAQGRAHDIRQVAILAGQQGISLRSGFFCNPGAGEAAFELGADDLQAFFRQPDFTFDDLRAWFRSNRGFDIGALRASFGLASTFYDAWRFVRFVHGFVDQDRTTLGTLPQGGAEADTVCAG